MAWVKLTYKDGWYPEGNTCILTNAEADGRWAGFKYAIFGLEENPHVAFWPNPSFVIKEESITKKEARRLMWKATNGNSLRVDFEKEYGPED